MTFSTVCADCRGDAPAIDAAETQEKQWESYPIEVQERKCRTCKQYRHWWWFRRT